MTWIKDIVEGLIEVYSTRNIYELLDQLDVTLIRKEFKSNVKGRFIRNIFGDEFIFISDQLSYEEERIVIAHELGHLILHTDLTTSYYTENHLLVKDRYEVEANKFAAELLIEDNVIIHEGETMNYVASLLNVTKELLMLKYEDVI
ncbi:ImmA/IrrE family metallo-endopeptidase [Tissierellaceae bacterium HCP3S3_D8]